MGQLTRSIRHFWHLDLGRFEVMYTTIAVQSLDGDAFQGID
ncbi:MAG: hypothetical protein JW388_1086 [Nitrospira sp.]|nr:hypothetical protein [Nitrospira sp.]